MTNRRMTRIASIAVLSLFLVGMAPVFAQTSQWRQVRRLEQIRYVRVSKNGQQNVVELIRRDFEAQ